MTYEEILRANMTDVLALPDDAVDWLIDLWRTIQVFDDIADGDHVDRADLDAAIWASLVSMPKNPFYIRNIDWLASSVATQVVKWLASDLAERNGRADARSYTWRAGYYDTVSLVCAMVHGPKSDIVEAALAMYGETLEDYMKEFKSA